MTTFAAGEVWGAEEIEGLVRHNRRLLEENSKLREYAVASERCRNHTVCRNYAGGAEERCPMLKVSGTCGLDDIARELGIGA